VVQIVGPQLDDDPGARAGLERAAERLRALLPAAAYEILELLYNLPAYLRLRAAARSFKPDLLYERYNLFLLAGMAYRPRGRLPMLLEVNSPLAAERADFGGLQLRSIAGRCEAALWKGADVVLPVTQVLARQVVEARGHGQGVQVIPNGANLGRRPPPRAAEAVRKRLGLSPDALVLGFAGFVRAWHGVGWALEALPTLPSHVHLAVAGDGPALAELQARAKALGLSSRLLLMGRVPHDQIADHIAAFDIALQTAATPYASPLKLFEYMALGRAIIAPDQENIREVLSDGQNALLFSPDSETSFRSALQRLCDDDALRARLGQGALRTVLETPLTWAQNAARIERLALTLLSPRTAGVSEPDLAEAAARP
jgi:glycosyltransferase involved in cell wall biosynthesis